MVKAIGHIGLAVSDLQKAVQALSEALALPEPAIVVNRELQLKMAFFDFNGVGLEVIEDFSEAGPLACFAREKGAGIHHICLVTDDIEEEIGRMKRQGVKFLGDKPVVGVRGKKRIFLTIETLEGIPIELSEP